MTRICWAKRSKGFSLLPIHILLWLICFEFPVSVCTDLNIGPTALLHFLSENKWRQSAAAISHPFVWKPLNTICLAREISALSMWVIHWLHRNISGWAFSACNDRRTLPWAQSCMLQAGARSSVGTAGPCCNLGSPAVLGQRAPAPSFPSCHSEHYTSLGIHSETTDEVIPKSLLRYLGPLTLRGAKILHSMNGF